MTTIVGLPSIDFGARFAAEHDVPARESRWLYLLLALRDPGTRLAIVTSEPVEPAIAAYYLDLIPDASDPWPRLGLFSVEDLSPRPLSVKLLERPDVIGAVREFVGQNRAYVQPFSALADVDSEAALALGVPVLGLDHRFAAYSGKSGSRRLLRDAGVPIPEGFEDIASPAAAEHALTSLGRPAVVKLEHGVTGSGNTIVRPGEPLPDLDGGAVVEALVDAAASPSVQARIAPGGHVEVLSVHEQVLAGQAYVGCRFPADGPFVAELAEHAARVGRTLAARGGVGRFALDFVIDRSGRAFAVEINPREGATTHPHATLLALGAHALRASDSVLVPSRPHWRDAFSALRSARLTWDPDRGSGAVLYMQGALHRTGELSVVALGRSRTEAEGLFWATLHELGATVPELHQIDRISRFSG
jgi:hypothetical protein